MSRIRKIKPKRVIQKPDPKKINIDFNKGASKKLEVFRKATLIDDIKTFKKILKEIEKKEVEKGVIGSSKEVGQLVDFKLSEQIGFKKNNTGFLDIVTAKYVTKHDEKKLEQIENKYKIIKIKDTLEAEGYSITESQTGDGPNQIIAKQEKDGEERIIEITTEKFEDSDKKNEDYSDDIVTVHSVNFEDEKECAEAADLLEHAFSGKIMEDRDTGEYSKKNQGNKRRERSGKKEEKSKIVSRSSRQRKNKRSR